MLGLEYLNQQQEGYYHEEGRINLLEGGRIEYTLKDHLGNGRVYCYHNAALNQAKTIQETHYYAFGLPIQKLSPNFEAPVGVEANNYQYNNKELNQDFGLHWMDYGARWYNPQINQWGQVDPLAEKYYAWSGYNYVLGNPVRLIDPDGKDPLFDEQGNFLGHYNDSDFDGEIMVMPANKYQQITGGRDVVISPTVVTDGGGKYLKNIFAGKEMPDYSDLILLSNLYTNLLVEADKSGILEFNKNDLFKGAIGISAGDNFNYKASSAYYGGIAHTGFVGSQIAIQVDIPFYDKEGKYSGPHLGYLSHAGNIISSLGYHEYQLHGKDELPPNRHLEIYTKQKAHKKSFDLTTPDFQKIVHDWIKLLKK